MDQLSNLIGGLVRNESNGWSIGSFGAIGEFTWDAQEPVEYRRRHDRIEVVTTRGAMQITPSEFIPIAWETLSPDGRAWGHTLAFCLSSSRSAGGGLIAFGPDLDSIRIDDRDALLFDLGICVGMVRMCVRTRDLALIGMMNAAQGADILGRPDILAELLKAQPHRVMLSPATRIEVFQPIPPPHGQSPPGPHTHVIPRLIAAKRAHSACDPLPVDLQSVLTLHPPSPWRLKGGAFVYDRESDEKFRPLLRQFGLVDERRVSDEIARALNTGAAPGHASWPNTRRGRAVARIALRRFAAAGDARVLPWRSLYDAAPGARTIPGECRRAVIVPAISQYQRP